MDANSKLGPNHIQGDPHEISKNGKLLEGIIERHGLCVVNGLVQKKKRNNHTPKTHSKWHGTKHYRLCVDK